MVGRRSFVVINPVRFHYGNGGKRFTSLTSLIRISEVGEKS